MLSYASVWPYFVCMAVFALGAAALGKTVLPQAIARSDQPSHFMPSLQGMRGLLACSVFFHHALFTRAFLSTGAYTMESTFYLHLGHSAVLSFFFITGFLFWGRVIQGATINTWAFWRARLLRLAPVHISAVFVVVVIIGVLSHGQMREPAWRVVGEILQWLSFGTLKPLPDINGFANTRSISSGVTWSLRYEVYFYLALPVLLWFARPRRFAVMVVGAFAVLGIFRLFRPEPMLDVLWNTRSLPVLHSHLVNSLVNWVLPVVHFFCIGFVPGMVAAYLKRRWGSPRVMRSPWASALLVALLAFQVFAVRPGYDLQVVPFLWGAFLLTALGCDMFGLLRTSGLQCLGAVSYSWYLLHGIVLFGVSRVINRVHPFATMKPATYWLFVMGTGLLVLGVSAASYLTLEVPFLHRRHARPVTA